MLPPSISTDGQNVAVEDVLAREMAVNFSGLSRRFNNLAGIQNEWIGAGVAPSKTITFRRIRKRGYNYRVPWAEPLLSLSQHRKHLNWATELKDRTVDQGSKLLFSGKSKACLSLGNQGAGG